MEEVVVVCLEVCLASVENDQCENPYAPKFAVTGDSANRTESCTNYGGVPQALIEERHGAVGEGVG